MDIRIKNNSNLFAPNAPDGWIGFWIFYFCLMVLVTLGAVLAAVIPPSWPFGLWALLGWVPVGLVLLACAGHIPTMIEQEAGKENALLYHEYRMLPEPVRKLAGTLTIDQICAFSQDDSKMVRDKLVRLHSAYMDNQRALTSPQVTGINHRLDDAITGLYESTDKLKEIS